MKMGAAFRARIGAFAYSAASFLLFECCLVVTRSDLVLCLHPFTPDSFGLHFATVFIDVCAIVSSPFFGGVENLPVICLVLCKSLFALLIIESALIVLCSVHTTHEIASSSFFWSHLGPITLRCKPGSFPSFFKSFLRHPFSGHALTLSTGNGEVPAE